MDGSHRWERASEVFPHPLAFALSFIQEGHPNSPHSVVPEPGALAHLPGPWLERQVLRPHPELLWDGPQKPVF